MKKILSLFLVLLACSYGCSSSESDAPIDNSEQDITLYSGEGRFLIKYKIPNDKITQIKTLYGTNAQPVVTNINAGSANKVIRIYVGNQQDPIEEGSYQININAYDQGGTLVATANKSIQVYGATYRATMKAHTFSKSIYQQPTTSSRELLNVNWDASAADDEIGITLYYTEPGGPQKKQFIEKRRLSAALILDNADLQKVVNYTTDYVPAKGSIDTLHTALTTLPVTDAPWINFYEGWTEKTLQKGVTLRTHQYPTGGLWGRTQNLSIIEVTPDANVRLDIAASKTLTKTSALISNKTIAAVNGSYFAWNKPEAYQSNTYLRLNNARLASDDIDANRKNGCMFINNGKIYFAATTGSTNWQDNFVGESALGGGPLLLLDGKLRSIEVKDHNTISHPRTFVGRKADGTVLLITVDGRTGTASGMPCTELQKLAVTLGCRDALNFDGGGSTTMVTRENGVVNIINHPSDAAGEREVANAIMVNPLN